MTKTGKIAAAILLVMLVAASLFLVFQDDIATAMDSEYEKKEQEEQKAVLAERGYVFLTYSPNKLGNFNFFDDCYAKAEQAVKDGRAESIKDYILDLEFDKEAYKKAEKAVADGKVKSIVESFSRHEDSGKIAFMLYYDPAFTAAWAAALDQNGISGQVPILKEEKDLPPEQQPDAALQRFMKNPDDWDKARERIISILWASNTKTELKEMSNYTSGMYQVKDGIDEGIPCVIVRKTTNSGGHFILFMVEVEKDTWKSIRFRLECGYQPVDVPNWPVPEDPPVPDNPPPTPQPKDPKEDLQNQPGADQHEFYSPDRVNNDPDKTETAEPTSPVQEYVAPTAPVQQEPTITEPTTTEAPTVTPIPTQQPEASKDTKSGSVTQDTDNGKVETHDDKEYQVEAGNGKDNGDLGEIADPTNPAKPEVEEPLKDDPVNTEEVFDFE